LNTLTVLTLNTWGGRSLAPLRELIRRRARSVDVFCFQEISSSPVGGICKLIGNEPYPTNLYELLQEDLPEHRGYFFGCLSGRALPGDYYFPHDWGLAIFVRRSLQTIGSGDEFVFRSRDDFDEKLGWISIPHNLAWVRFRFGEESFTVYNLHGLWNGRGKGDSLERIHQAHSIERTVAAVTTLSYGPHILCGDFNLDAHASSMGLLRRGRIDLIREHGITNTRTPLYNKWGDESASMFADYILLSADSGLEIDSFELLPDVVSDHAALQLTVSFPFDEDEGKDEDDV
jgi:hypothetical protein